jgi:hypothetical protein
LKVYSGKKFIDHGMRKNWNNIIVRFPKRDSNSVLSSSYATSRHTFTTDECLGTGMNLKGWNKSKVINYQRLNFSLTGISSNTGTIVTVHVRWRRPARDGKSSPRQRIPKGSFAAGRSDNHSGHSRKFHNLPEQGAQIHAILAATTSSNEH